MGTILLQCVNITVECVGVTVEAQAQKVDKKVGKITWSSGEKVLFRRRSKWCEDGTQNSAILLYKSSSPPSFLVKMLRKRVLGFTITDFSW